VLEKLTGSPHAKPGDDSMVGLSSRKFLPLELVFNPRWWYETSGIKFDASFYFDLDKRIYNDVTMRRVLHERFGSIGLGEPYPQPRPLIGSQHVAGGFVIPALLGAKILFVPDAAPQPVPVQMNPAQIDLFEKPDFSQHWPMKQLMADMDILQKRYGFVLGDLNTDGLLNAAYHMYGPDLFIDFYAAPRRVRRLLDLIGELIMDVALYVRSRTGSCSISVNRMVERVDPAMFLHANCSVQMISSQSYRELQLAIEKRMAARIQPYGIHHCGDNLHKLAGAYAELSPAFVDVGWGSDAALCRRKLPEAFLNLRLSPVRMLHCTPAEIKTDVERLLLDVRRLENVGVCCINMDYGTPDENIFAMFEVIERYRHYGA
jgi:hypothetical protein